MKRISLLNQAGALKSYFPNSTIKRIGEYELTWEGELKPSISSRTYKIKLRCRIGKSPKIYVIKPQLKLAEGKKYLPHVYSTPEQQLCLYYPDNREWNQGMYYVNTIIPWTSEWLYHYEIWVSTGNWHGGGVVHENEVEIAEEKSQSVETKY